MLTDAQKVDVRRYAGYPLLADQTADDARDFAYAWVLPGVMQTLFHRLNNLRAEEEAVLIAKYLVPLNALEDAVVAASDNLDTDAAAVWTRNRAEVRDRTNLFNQIRRDMCSFLGMQPGPELGAGGVKILRG